MPIEWTTELATGVDEFDAQHRELYANVAALHAAMRANQLYRVMSTLEFLERYVRGHFGTEERWMAEAAYPGLEAHRRLHQEFVVEFRRRQEAFLAEGPIASQVIELSEWLGDWLRDHVRGVDREMGRYIRDAR
jgi:hemerythrin